MPNKVSEYGICPFATTQRVLTGKWALVIIYQLSTGTKRFKELQRLLPGITQTILTRHLRQLEKDKIIQRKVYAEVPPRVEYSLTEIGQEFKMCIRDSSNPLNLDIHLKGCNPVASTCNLKVHISKVVFQTLDIC